MLQQQKGKLLPKKDLIARGPDFCSFSKFGCTLHDWCILVFLQASSAGVSGEMRLMKNNVAMSSAASDNEGASHTIFGTVTLELAAGDEVSPFVANSITIFYSISP